MRSSLRRRIAAGSGRCAFLTLLLFSSVSAAAPGRRFHIEHTYSIKPTGAHEAWLYAAIPADDPWQRVTALKLDGAPFELVHDARDGNTAARVRIPDAGLTLRVSYEVEREERAAELARATGRPAPSGYARWLEADALVPVNDRVHKIAADVTRGKRAPLDQARAIYAYVLSTMKYDKSGTGWGHGDLLWACDQKYGNCTDFHALLIGLLRATGIPARFQIGYSVPPDFAGELAGYHCWADFYLDGVGWVPIDASEAWKHPDKRDYFFGHHDANRVALSTGRDLVFPGMKGAPLNYFVYPYAESSGAALEVTRATRVSQ